LIDAHQLARLVTSFAAAGDETIQKSRELVLQLLQHTPSPFSRSQFLPGHITSTGLVLHPRRDAFVLVHHRRLDRWLLPGGHVEPPDSEIWETARREVVEETGAVLLPDDTPLMVGIDVHGIPPGRREPYHLHHDLIFAFRAASDSVMPTEEVRRVVWCDPNQWDLYNLPLSIRLSARRAFALVHDR
jgi:8-oxo-dGTP pyrophosphatase MutT (NUDIX family)